MDKYNDNFSLKILWFNMEKQCKYNRRGYQVIIPTSKSPEDSKGENR